MPRLARMHVLRRNGIYHITSRGNRRANIYLDTRDRNQFLALLHSVVTSFGWLLHAYCLMTNHFHLLVQTPTANLSDGMRTLNGDYARYFNRKYDLDGHLFQGRYGTELVESPIQLCRAARYIELNPVRAKICRDPADWKWSSYRATIGIVTPPAFLTTSFVIGQFGFDESTRRAGYLEFVAEGIRAAEAA